jgi:hypothetical protein
MLLMVDLQLTPNKSAQEWTPDKLAARFSVDVERTRALVKHNVRPVIVKDKSGVWIGTE